MLKIEYSLMTQDGPICEKMIHCGGWALRLKRSLAANQSCGPCGFTSLVFLRVICSPQMPPNRVGVFAYNLAWLGGSEDMKASRFTEEQIIGILNEHETGRLEPIANPFGPKVLPMSQV